MPNMNTNCPLASCVGIYMSQLPVDVSLGLLISSVRGWTVVKKEEGRARTTVGVREWSRGVGSLAPSKESQIRDAPTLEWPSMRSRAGISSRARYFPLWPLLGRIRFFWLDEFPVIVRCENIFVPPSRRLGDRSIAPPYFHQDWPSIPRYVPATPLNSCARRPEEFANEAARARTEFDRWTIEALIRVARVKYRSKYERGKKALLGC